MWLILIFRMHHAHTDNRTEDIRRYICHVTVKGAVINTHVKVLKEIKVYSSTDLPITLPTFHNFTTSFSWSAVDWTIPENERSLLGKCVWRVKGTQWCPRGDWVITRKSHEVQMECLLYPGVTPVMGILSQAHQDLHWARFVLVVAF